MATPKNGLPNFWSTGLAKILVGDQPCQFETWAKAHLDYEKKPMTSSLAEWKANHTTMLDVVLKQAKDEGWKCTVEKYFRLTGQTAILAGKTDLIKQADGKRPTIVDIKSGTPRESDVAQVEIYMVAIPLAWGAPGMIFDGEVVYASHTVKITPADAETLKPKLFALLRRLAGDVRPDPVPSEHSCRFCEIPMDVCSVRWMAETNQPEAITTLF